MDNKRIGQKCAEYRRSIHISQRKVAEELGYSVENVSAFENGRNDNMNILLWYLDHGMRGDYLHDNHRIH